PLLGYNVHSLQIHRSGHPGRRRPACPAKASHRATWDKHVNGTARHHQGTEKAPSYRALLHFHSAKSSWASWGSKHERKIQQRPNRPRGECEWNLFHSPTRAIRNTELHAQSVPP